MISDRPATWFVNNQSNYRFIRQEILYINLFVFPNSVCKILRIFKRAWVPFRIYKRTVRLSIVKQWENLQASHLFFQLCWKSCNMKTLAFEWETFNVYHCKTFRFLAQMSWWLLTPLTGLDTILRDDLNSQTDNAHPKTAFTQYLIDCRKC